MKIIESRNKREGHYAGQWQRSMLREYPGLFWRAHPSRHRRAKDRFQPLRDRVKF